MSIKQAALSYQFSTNIHYLMHTCRWTLNRIVLTKLVDAVTSGDHVELSSNEKKVKEMQEEHGGWNSEMEKVEGPRLT